MRHQIVFLFIVFLSFNVSGTSSNLVYSNSELIEEFSLGEEFTENYKLRSFCEDAAHIIALFAHPTSIYEGYYAEVYQDYADLTINYEQSKMVVRVSVSEDNLIDNIQILRDEDFWPAFFASSILKDMIDDLLNSNDPELLEVKSAMEEVLDETYYQWDGQDLCLFALNCEWIF